ncbi:MAG: sigma-70 family RNA polymerase sigma factor, partial [Gammaproteobacteria bacterium]|nr:sigma-70 family RNA polymerase sigma factor [Gammaproteobacteria bacterium]NIR84494.1 sigma-70 family RNA polymerase sigma factor [Gammaproteobacteria bacterium]NIR90397.1 sigma-70 family RNA polymerase sigma factor [Gammaproteobacteria bacterium]NIU05545.1 sigma-70 family RNA polymerase sigma factor [Gammaproteobacteria bacterium]NIV52684.1 sigma-70 family RNA polymerase sigma factor [Gammaproteobacteria bacterium]
ASEARKPREIALELSQACAEWRARTSAPGPELEAAKIRTASAFHAIEPAFPVLCRALEACKHLDDRVRDLEARLAVRNADIGPVLESTLGVTKDGRPPSSQTPGRRVERARAELLRIESESGTTLATLRESSRAAAQAAARYRRARQRMVEANLRLAYYTARKFVNYGVSLDDLVQAANLGLIRAADKFDYRLGYKFSTYASQWIWQSVTRVLADESRTIRVAAHMHDTILRLNKMDRQLQQKLGRSPTLQELAEASGLPLRKVRKALQSAQHTLSLDAPVAETEDTTLRHWVEDEAQPDPSETAHDAQVERAVAELLSSLPEREALILRLRHGIGVAEPMTLEQIGGVLGITRERTRQLEARAMTRLRRRASPHLLRALSK